MDDTSISELLNQIDRLDQEATQGPWIVHPDVKYVYTTDAGMVLDRAWADQPDADLHLAALARTALPKLAEAVYHVLDLLDVVEKSDKYSYGFGGSKSPSLVTTNEVRKAITDVLGDDCD